MMRWGMIGCGKVAELKSAPAYNQVKDFNLCAVYGRTPEHVADYARRHQIPEVYHSSQELIKQVDAVYIATPPDAHSQYAFEVLEANKPCCIEKPLSVSYYAAKKIVSAFETAKIPLFVAYYRRSLPRFKKVKHWLDKELIGKPRHITWNFSKPANDKDISQSYNWRTDPKIAPGGYFNDLACHGLDLFNYLLGDITEAIGLAVNQQGLYTAKDSVSACWLHPNNITGSGSWNFGANKRQDFVEILGSKGKIHFSVLGEEAISLENEVGHKQELIENPKNIQLHHVEGIKNALENNVPHVSTGLTALHTNWVMDKILGEI